MTHNSNSIVQKMKVSRSLTMLISGLLGLLVFGIQTFDAHRTAETVFKRLLYFRFWDKIDVSDGC